MPAERKKAAENDDVTLQFVIFQVDRQNYGVEINRVKEIIRYRKVTPLPKAPEFIEGVIDLRGKLIPIIDLRKRFDVPDIRETSDTRIMILRMKRKMIGLVVDGVSRVLHILVQNIQAPPPLTRARGSDYILAVAKHQNDLYIVLDLDKILTTSEKVKLEDVKLSNVSLSGS